MTTKAAFSADQWQAILEAPPTAGMIVATAARGGMLRESIAMSRAYLDARAQHGESELLDEIVAARPELDPMRFHSAGELRDNGLQNIQAAVTLLDSKATAEETDGYRRFVLELANRVAAAQREDEGNVSSGEAEAIKEVATALGTTSS